MGKKTINEPVEASPPSPLMSETAARAAEAAAKAAEAAAVAADEHARAARRLLDNREYLFNEEVKLAEAECVSLEERLDHELALHNEQLWFAERKVEAAENAVELLYQAHRERFDADKRVAKELLGRREDAARMHEQLIELRQYFDRELRAGLEGFRAAYRAQAFEEVATEARRALLDQQVVERYASQEHAWAERWQGRYEALKAVSDLDKRELELTMEQKRMQAARILKLRRQVKDLAAAESTVEQLRTRLALQETASCELHNELQATRTQLVDANLARARALHEVERLRIERLDEARRMPLPSTTVPAMRSHIQLGHSWQRQTAQGHAAACTRTSGRAALWTRASQLARAVSAASDSAMVAPLRRRRWVLSLVLLTACPAHSEVGSTPTRAYWPHQCRVFSLAHCTPSRTQP